MSLGTGRDGTASQYISSRKHLLSGLVILIGSVGGLVVAAHDFRLEPVAGVVGYHYGLVVIHGLESGNLEGGSGVSHYIGFALWFGSFVLAASVFLLHVSPALYFSGGIGIGVGYLTGWLLYYR